MNAKRARRLLRDRGLPGAGARSRLRGASATLAVFALITCLQMPGAAHGATAPVSRTLEVFAAASLSEPFTALARRFEREHPGVRVRANFAGSHALAAQIEQGAPADVFASADERWMSALAGRGLLAGGAAVLAHNRLVVIVPRSDPARLRTLADLARPGIKLVLAADAVPAGRYARAVLRHLARDPALGAGFADRVLRNVVSDEENVKSVVAKVQLGEADAGMVYRSDVTPAIARVVRTLAIPDSANVVVRYPIAIVRGAREPDLAQAFVALVRSPAGQGVLAGSGLAPVTE